MAEVEVQNHSSEIPDSSDIPVYPTKILEVIGISIGAIATIGVAVIGIGNKLVAQVFDGDRSKDIAKQVVDYQIPGGAKGLFNFHFGAESFAVIGNQASPPSIVLLVSQEPTEPEGTPLNLANELGLESDWLGDWLVSKTHTEQHLVCNQTLPITKRTGKYLMRDQQTPTVATEYVIQRTMAQQNQTFHVLATGANADKTAIAVLKSLRCKD